MPGESAVYRSQSMPMSLTTFQFEVKLRWNILIGEESALANTCTLFAGEKEIWPDQCKRILTLLYKIENPVQELSAMFENPAYLPVSVVQRRHLSLMALQHTSEQIRDLIALIAEYCTLCQIPSKQAAKLRQQIEQGLDVLVQECDEVINNTASLLDQTRFQERKIISSSQQSNEFWREFHSYQKYGVTLNELGRKQEAKDYLAEALRLVHKIGDRKREGKVLNDLGRTCSALGKKTEALGYLEKALETIEEVGDRRSEAEILNNLSLVCIDLGHQEEARGYLDEALVLVQEIADRRQEGRIRNTLGLLFDHLGQWEEAKTWFEQALEIRRELHDHKGEGVTLNNLGRALDNLGQKNQAQQHLKEALRILREEGDLWGEGKTLSNLGQFYAEIGEYETAISYYQQALTILREVGDRYEESRTEINLSRLKQKIMPMIAARKFLKYAQ